MPPTNLLDQAESHRTQGNQNMNDSWPKSLVDASATLQDTLQTIDASCLRIAVVADKDRHVLGTVTDGDIRRGLLAGLELHAPVTKVMNTNPTLASPNDTKSRILGWMKAKQILHVPIVDTDRRLIGMHIYNDLVDKQQPIHWVVLMAGGLGSRLAPLTDHCPKPLLDVGGRPILETIIRTLAEQGFHQFYVSVNHKANLIKDFLNNGAQWGVEIRYLQEKEKLGTAGALSLLPENPSDSILIMNADLLTKLNARKLMAFHEAHGGHVTLGVRKYQMQVPYGVVKTQHTELIEIQEKPIHEFYISSGICALSPEVLQLIIPGKPLNMPDLINLARSDGLKTLSYPVQEYWTDIGRIEDYIQANLDFPEVFTK